MNSQSKRNKKQKLIAFYGHYCWWCAKDLKEDEMTIEHLLPRSSGGTNSWENLRLSCKQCNNSRGNSLFPPGWKTSR